VSFGTPSKNTNDATAIANTEVGAEAETALEKTDIGGRIERVATDTVNIDPGHRDETDFQAEGPGHFRPTEATLAIGATSIEADHLVIAATTDIATARIRDGSSDRGKDFRSSDLASALLA
jgi:hypothetical protein